jgi:hypothetical protein
MQNLSTMKNSIKLIFSISVLLISLTVNAQIIIKPNGCYAGTNGFQPAVMSHPESRGVLIAKKWYEIEISPGVFDFNSLNSDINKVKAAGLKYSLAILAGAVGSPDWIIDMMNVDFISYEFKGDTVRLPFWWDTIVQTRLDVLISELGVQYSQDTSLSHVYVTQMTTNGVEGHLNGLNINDFNSVGFTNQKWIDAAKTTTYSFANAFPNVPIVFEVHEINNDTIVPATVINELYADPALCKRVGLSMWWISGKTSYQPNLINYISNFNGDKYAQVIGRSDQLERFEDSLYSNVFVQAKQLGIRYIEPWPFEFQNHTHDSLFQDFNQWSDNIFLTSDTCSGITAIEDQVFSKPNNLSIYPNPNNGKMTIEQSEAFSKIQIIDVNGQIIFEKKVPLTKSITIDVSNTPNGIYLIKVLNNKNVSIQKIMKK